MNSKVGSLEEKVKLPPTETISRCYQPQGNRKVIRILTVAVYVLCVSLAAIMLSLYYIFIWDPTIRPFTMKGNNCDKIVIPEKIAIRLLNSSEVTAEQFYKHILEQYRILNHLQLQRQQFLQKQQLQLQKLAAANKFQEIFATATIIQTNRNDIFNKRVTPTNGTFLLEPPKPPPMTIEEQQQQQLLQLQQQQQQLQMQLIQRQQEQQQLQLQQQPQMTPILDTTTTHIKRKSHRKHYNSNNQSNNNSHHRHNTRKNRRKNISSSINNNTNNIYNEQEQEGQRRYIDSSSEVLKTPVAAVLNEQIYTPIPIPIILNTREEKRPHHHDHASRNSPLQPKRRTTSATSVTGYDTPTYMNPFLTGELIFEK